MPSNQPIKGARGVRDVLPAERAAWRIVEGAAQATATIFGYQEIVTPLIEPAELIERGVGSDTDAGGKELYRLMTYKESSARLVLRPEGTAGIVRAYFEGSLNQAPQPVRLFNIGPMFRHDRPQAGRYRQFTQFDIESIGDPAPALDAEAIEVGAEWLAAVGIGGWTLELNSIGDASCRPAYLERLRAHYRPLKDRLCADDQRRLESNPLRLLDCKEEACAEIKRGAPRITDHLCSECAAAFASVKGLLEAGGFEYVLNPFLVRGLDYYTRTVFEFQHGGGAQNALLGGGRYDGLAGELGYPNTPAVGFAAGMERVVETMLEQGGPVVSAPAAELLVIPDGASATAAAAVARLARRSVATMVDYSERSLRSKMRAANKSGARWVAIMNGEEAERRVVQLREMAGGEQSEVGWDQLSGRIR